MNNHNYLENSLITVGRSLEYFWMILTIVQLEDKFTSLFSFIFDHTEEVYFKCFSDVQYNDDGDYILGYVSIKIPNKFVRETVIETAYLNGYGYRQEANFPFS